MTWRFLSRWGAQLDSIVEFAPSTGWLMLMLWPFLYQYSDFHPATRFFQLAVVSIIFLLLFLSDLLCFKRSIKKVFVVDGRVGKSWLVYTGIFFLVPVAVHLYLMPKIPLLSWVLDNEATRSSLMLLREGAAKLLDVPTAVKYLFVWPLVILAPAYIVIAFWAGHWGLALMGLVIASLYAVATLAKFSLVLLWSTCLFASCTLPNRFRRVLSSAWIGAVLLGVAGVSILLLSGALDFMKIGPAHAQSLVFSEMKEDDPRRTLTLGDVARLESLEAAQERSKAVNIATYALYRVWLTPSDVSHRWYQYFTYVKKEPLGLLNFIPTRAMQNEAPSREVGIWAYQERFPDKYAASISAYASFDADAFAHGGVWGVALATILLLLVRVGAAFLLAAHPVGLVSYGVLLCGLGILPSSASLQAMLGAHGLFLILILLLVLRLWSVRTGKSSVHLTHSK
jgi:hypothetical protein